MWIDNRKFHRAENQSVPTPGLMRPTSIPNSEPIDTGPRPPPQDTRDSLEREDEHQVIENLPAVRVAAAHPQVAA
jgi:hypothetical protein